MPYMVRCRSCGHFYFSSDASAIAKTIDHFQNKHRSLRWHYGRIQPVEITRELYEAYKMLREDPRFWKALNESLSKKSQETILVLDVSCVPLLYRGLD